MIAYDNSRQFGILLQFAGSVIPRSIPIGFFTGSIGLALAILREFRDKDVAELSITKAFAVQILATVVGYLIVVRTNMALSRYMDGIADVQMMLSKWGDAYILLASFFSGREGSPEVHRKILLFRVRIAHWFSLMSCLAFATLRGGACLTSLDDVPIQEMLDFDEEETTDDVAMIGKESSASEKRSEKPSQVSFGVSSSKVSLKRTRSFAADIVRSNSAGSSSERISRLSRPSQYGRRKSRSNLSAFDEDDNTPWRQSAVSRASRAALTEAKGDAEGIRNLDLYVLHRPTDEEVERLEATSDKVNLICLWIIQGIVLELRAGTLDTPPPIVTRVFQELSHGMLGFSQAHKVAMVPFPFPFAQMVSILLCFLYIVLPFYIDSFTRNVAITPLISFLVPVCYNGLNSLAIELEAPFGCDCNDVDIEERHKEFLGKMLDVIRQPMKPPIGAQSAGSTPEKKIWRGIRRAARDVHSRISQRWHWDLVELDCRPDGMFCKISTSIKEEEATQSTTVRYEGDDQEALPIRDGSMTAITPREKESIEETPPIEFREESPLEEMGKGEETRRLPLGARLGLICGPTKCSMGCEPDGSMPVISGDLGNDIPDAELAPEGLIQDPEHRIIG